VSTAVTPRILVVEDEPDIAAALRLNLELEGYEIEIQDEGNSALQRALAGGHDLILLDVMLPGLDGVNFCEQLRAVDAETPILVLSALGDVADRVRGLAAGGDDYLPKPFDLQELLLRVQALLKRREVGAQPVYGRDVLRLGAVKVNLRSGELQSPAGVHRLTEKEFQILRYLAERRGQIVKRVEILDRVWGPQSDPTERTVDNFIVRLRKLLEEDPSQPRYLHTHRGLGYRLTPAPEESPS
jgi:DNA-binding response OmpR family regulator